MPIMMVPMQQLGRVYAFDRYVRSPGANLAAPPAPASRGGTNGNNGGGGGSGGGGGYGGGYGGALSAGRLQLMGELDAMQALGITHLRLLAGATTEEAHALQFEAQCRQHTKKHKEAYRHTKKLTKYAEAHRGTNKCSKEAQRFGRQAQCSAGSRRAARHTNMYRIYVAVDTPQIRIRYVD